MRYILTAVFSLYAMILSAQNIIEFDPVTITATRTPKKAGKTGSNITVLDKKLLQQLPANSIDEMLKYVSGIEIQQRGPAGAQSDIIIRGGTFQQVLVLLDGIKINDPVTGHFSSYIPVAPDEIERIEILRGSAAAIYGSEAVGGVINIITQTFDHFTDTKNTKAAIATAAGEYGFFDVNAGIYNSSPKVNIAAGINTVTANGPSLRGIDGYFHTNTVSLSAAFTLPKNWKLMLRSSFDHRSFAAQNFYTSFASDTAMEKVSSWWNQLKLLHRSSKNTDEIDAAYKQTKDHYLFNKQSVANDNSSGYFMLQYIHTGTISSQLKFNYGGAADNRIIRSNDRGDHQTWHGAAFSSLYYSYKNWHAQSSLRLDADKSYGYEFLPQLNLSYQLKKIILRGGAGKAIRSPDYTERYNNYGKALVTSGKIGNADLVAERSWSFETGADLLLKNYKISVTGFYRKQNDLIDWVNTAYTDMPRKTNLSPAGNYALAENIKWVNTRGCEIELSYKTNLTATSTLYINAAASFIHSSNNDKIPSFYIIAHAKQIINGSVIYTGKKFSVAFTAIYKKREPQQASAINAAITTDYFLINGKFQYHFSKRISTFLATNNIGNISYSDLLGSKMPGRWTTAGLKINF